MLEYMRSHTRGGARKNGGPHGLEFARQFHQAFGERDRRAGENRQHFDHDALRDMRGGQKRDRDVVRRQGQDRRAHVDVGCERARA